MADRVEHLPDLAVAPFADGDLQRGTFLLPRARVYARARDVLRVAWDAPRVLTNVDGASVVLLAARLPPRVGARGAARGLGERWTLDAARRAVSSDRALSAGLGPAAVDHDASPKPREIVLVGHAEHARLVDPLDAVARMRQPGRQVAVVGQEQETFGVEVEPADGIDVLADSRRGR